MNREGPIKELAYGTWGVLSLGLIWRNLDVWLNDPTLWDIAHPIGFLVMTTLAMPIVAIIILATLYIVIGIGCILVTGDDKPWR